MNWRMNLNLQCHMMLYLKDSKITNSKKNTTKKARKKRMKALLATKKLISDRVTQERACTFHEMV